MSNSTFPPRASSAGFALPAGLTWDFVPDAAGAPPAGWAWLDGMLSNGYDQGSANSDVFSRGDMSAFPVFSPAVQPWEFPQLMTSDFQSNTHYSTLNGLPFGVTTSPADGTFQSASAYSSDGSPSLNISSEQASGRYSSYAFTANVQQVYACGTLSVPGHPLPTYWTGVGLDDGTYCIAVENLLPTSDNGFISWTGIAVAFQPLAGTLTAAGVLTVFGPDDNYQFQGVSIDLASGTTTPLTDATAATWVLGVSSRSNAATFLGEEGLGGLRACRTSVVDGVFVITPYSGALPYRTYNDWFAANDGTLWRYDDTGVWRVSASGVIAQVAGRHPALATLGRCSVVLTQLPSNLLTEPMALNVFELGAKNSAGGTAYAAAKHLQNVTLGGMLASFKRSATYQGA